MLFHYVRNMDDSILGDNIASRYGKNSLDKLIE